MDNENKLEIFNKNIIKWYPFKNCKKILQIGENQNIKNELCKIFESVNSISKIDELFLNPNEIYDYIIIYGYENYEIEIDKLFNLLSDDGIILIIGNNSLGINNWSKYQNSKDVSICVENINYDGLKLMKLLDEVQKKGYYSNNFFAFPNYEHAEIIINEKYEKFIDVFEKYLQDFSNNDIVIFDEKKVLKNIIKSNFKLIEIFGNSYFIEASKSEIKNNIYFATFNNCRKEQYREITILSDNNVKKIPAEDNAIEHLQDMGNTIENAKKDGFNILDYKENGIIYSKLIKDQKTYDKILFENIDNQNKVIELLKLLQIELLKKSINFEEIQDENFIFKEYCTNQEILRQFSYLKHGYWDMIAKNCFYIDGNFNFFDQEWEEKYIPVEFIIYRSIINSYELVLNTNIDAILEKLDLLKFKDLFNLIDLKLQEKIFDKDIYECMYNKNANRVNDLIEKYNNQKNDILLKENYIKKLEKILDDFKIEENKKLEYIESLKQDNMKKQEYIEILEKKANKKGIFRRK